MKTIVAYIALCLWMVGVSSAQNPPANPPTTTTDPTGRACAANSVLNFIPSGTLFTCGAGGVYIKATGGSGGTCAALAGDVTGTCGANTLSKIQGTAVSGVTGTGNAVLSTSPTLVTPILGIITSGDATNLVNIPVANAIGNLSTSNLNGGSGATNKTFWAGSGAWTNNLAGSFITSGAATANCTSCGQFHFTGGGARITSQGANSSTTGIFSVQLNSSDNSVNDTTVGRTGAALVFGRYASSGDESASIADTTIKAVSSQGAGEYRFTIYVASNGACVTPGPAAVTVGAKWTDITGAQKTISAIPLDVNGAATLTGNVGLGDTTTYGSGWLDIYSNASVNIIFNTALTACTTGTAKYRIYVTVEQLQ